MTSKTNKKRVISLVVSPYDSVGALQAALSLAGVEHPVVDLGANTAVYVNQEQQEQDDQDALEELLGSKRPLPTKVAEVAKLVSKLSSKGAVALTAWVAPDVEQSEHLAGNIVARRYVGGEEQQDLPAGMVLTHFDLVAEELLLGRLDVEQVGEWRKTMLRPTWMGRILGGH